MGHVHFEMLVGHDSTAPLASETLSLNCAGHSEGPPPTSQASRRKKMRSRTWRSWSLKRTQLQRRRLLLRTTTVLQSSLRSAGAIPTGCVLI